MLDVRQFCSEWTPWTFFFCLKWPNSTCCAQSVLQSLLSRKNESYKMETRSFLECAQSYYLLLLGKSHWVFTSDFCRSSLQFHAHTKNINRNPLLILDLQVMVGKVKKNIFFKLYTQKFTYVAKLTKLIIIFHCKTKKNWIFILIL